MVTYLLKTLPLQKDRTPLFKPFLPVYIHTTFQTPSPFYTFFVFFGLIRLYTNVKFENDCNLNVLLYISWTLSFTNHETVPHLLIVPSIEAPLLL